MVKGILVVGELNVDIIVIGLPRFPMLGQEVLVRDIDLVLGSSSAICAAGLARLGASVDMVGKVGDDFYGNLVIERLRERGVGTAYIVQDRALRTGITISLAFTFDRALITYTGCIAALRLEDVPLHILPQYAHLHVGSYFLQRDLRPGLLALFREAHRAGLTTSLDTGCDPEGQWDGGQLWALLEETDIFLPNEQEARAIARTSSTETALRGLAQRAGLVVIKRGRKGALSLQEGHIIESPGFSIQSVDTTGAGDSFDAGFLFAHLIQGRPLAQALSFANACGALSTTAYGGTAAQPTLDEVESFLKEHAR